MNRTLATLALLLLTLATPLASAQQRDAWPHPPPANAASPAASPDALDVLDPAQPPPPDAADTVALNAALWLWATSHDQPELPASARGLQRGLYSLLRPRLTLAFTPTLSVIAEADLLTGQLLGDDAPSIRARAITGATPRDRAWQAALQERALYLDWTSPVGIVRAGLQTSRWGLGLLAHDGAPDPRQLFNQPFGGDRTLRALFATAPFALASPDAPDARRLIVALAADLITRDDLASLRDEDRAAQGVASLLYQADAGQFGAYVVYRDQRDRDGANLNIWVIDLAASGAWMLDADRWELELEAELAAINGTTDRALPITGEARTRVRAIGAAAHAHLTHRPTDLALRLQAGYASGDANSDDATLFRFRFDPNYKVGLILFDTFLPAVTRAAYARAADPTQSGAPQRGLENLVSDGGVENALYLNPQVTFGDPRQGFMAGVGALWARADRPVVDPYLSFRRGGTPTGPFGADANDDLGAELDVAMLYRHPFTQDLAMELKAEFGIFFPGDAFDDAQGRSSPPQNLVRGRVALTF